MNSKQNIKFNLRIFSGFMWSIKFTIHVLVKKSNEKLSFGRFVCVCVRFKIIFILRSVDDNFVLLIISYIISDSGKCITVRVNYVKIFRRLYYICTHRVTNAVSASVSRLRIPKHKLNILRVFTAFGSQRELLEHNKFYFHSWNQYSSTKNFGERREVLRLPQIVWMNQWRPSALSVFLREDFIVGCECADWNRCGATVPGAKWK